MELAALPVRSRNMVDRTPLCPASNGSAPLGDVPALGAWLSRSLRSRYDAVLREPLPASLQALLSGMDRAVPGGSS